jgi:hypothetical protein
MPLCLSIEHCGASFGLQRVIPLIFHTMPQALPSDRDSVSLCSTMLSGFITKTLVLVTIGCLLINSCHWLINDQNEIQLITS